jgi:hypothetical protein
VSVKHSAGCPTHRSDSELSRAVAEGLGSAFFSTSAHEKKTHVENADCDNRTLKGFELPLLQL